MLYGYAGTVLRIDLTRRKIEKQPLNAEFADKYIGGRGFVARILYDEIPQGLDPFSEDNIVVAATGPLSGYYLPASGKTHFGTKSPATGGYADGNMGGHFGTTLKYAGYDMLILKGRADVPSFLYIEDDKVEIRPAESYWGKGSITLEKEMKKDLGDDFEICTIGPAGENRVRFACISHDFGRQCGRTGIGTVLGDKQIKAIAVKGTKSLKAYDLEGLVKASKKAYEGIYEKPGFKGWTPEGTAGITNFVNQVGAFPTRNFQTSYSDHHEQINGKAVIEKLKVTDKGCFCCPIPCGKYGHARTKLGDVYVEGPEFETISLFGGNCELQDIHEIAHVNHICDELGIDTISAGVVAAFAIECFEKGIITKEQIGRDVRFGDFESVVHLLEIIANRKGVGDILANGVKTAAEKLGKGSEKFAVHVKGLEWTGYECRNAPGMMLAYLTADIGAHHNRAWVLGHDVAGAATSVHDLITEGGSGQQQAKAVIDAEACVKNVIDSQHLRPMFDVLGTCRLQMMELGFEVDHYERLFAVITGKKRSWKELISVSEMIWHLTRSFSVRENESFGRHMDAAPPRLCREPVKTGPNKGHYITEDEIDLLLDAYYKARGWEKNGIPAQKTLISMGLSDIAKDLETRM